MPNNTYTGAAAGAWATGGNWSLGHQPTGSETAVLDAEAPTGPVIDTTIGGLTVALPGPSFNGGVHLIVSGAVSITANTVSIKSQSGGTVTLTGTGDGTADLSTTGTCAGNCSLTGDSALTAGTYSGAVLLGDGVIGGPRLGTVTITGALTTTGMKDFSAVTWGAASTITFTGSDAGVVTSANGSAPATITAATDLFVLPAVNGTTLDLAGATITTGGHFIATGFLPSNPSTIDLDGATITGPSTAGKCYVAISVSGTPIVTGFEPLYKLGAAGSTLDSFGSGAVITLPVKADVKSGVVYGPSDNQQLGELSSSSGGGRGGMGLNL